MTAAAQTADTQKGILGWIERTGNKLPDPAFIFLYLIGVLIVVSILSKLAGLSALHPTQLNADGTPVVIAAASLLSAENIQRLWVDMPKTFTHFHPLGYVLVVMLGAGIAERSGLFASAMRGAVRNAPKFLLTPMVALTAMIGNLAADAAYVVLIPLAGVLYAAAGRHPIAGIAAAFAGVSGGFSANLFPGQLDALLFGITEATAVALVPDWSVNIVGNWYFIAGMTFIFLPVIWFVTDNIIEPRLGGFEPQTQAGLSAAESDKPLTDGQRKGLGRAGLAMIIVCVLWLLMTIGPGTPLMDESKTLLAEKLTPFFKSLVAGFFVLFLAAGWAYGSAAGTVKDHRDIVRMMSESMADLAYYLVLAFFAAHFVAMFAWSNLGIIFAVHGAGAIESAGLPAPITLAFIILLTGVVNLFVGSASAKWALLAPVLVPMLMLLGISPEAATAAYRVGDSATNIITPLMVYFPLILTFCQRWKPEFGLGSLTATMIPYS
ncbi:MAG: AbgT family transporter, partial [Marinicaulis sp.]|nr:AbgT family transporter [Marinicaulis sp.]